MNCVVLIIDGEFCCDIHLSYHLGCQIMIFFNLFVYLLCLCLCFKTLSHLCVQEIALF